MQVIVLHYIDNIVCVQQECPVGLSLVWQKSLLIIAQLTWRRILVTISSWTENASF